MGEWGSRNVNKPEKLFNDPIHGHIRLNGDCVRVLDSPQFQWLRYIKQLAAASFVFTGATHDRLSHSIGTCHLAQMMLDQLGLVQPELEIETFEVEAVTLAALCHDVGHGPFSHALDNEIIPAIVGESNWNHEERSTEILDFLIDDNHLEIDADIVSMAKDFIISKIPEKGTKHYPRRFLWDIVANGRTNVDVDKFDYLARDSKYCGVPTSFDHQRVMNMMRVVDGEICFDAREAEAVYELFAMRSKMHRTVYQHKSVKAIEYMVVDALTSASSVYGFSEMMIPGHIREFCELDDTILREIHRKRDPLLRPAQDILRRIEKRELYKWVNEFPIPSKFIQNFKPVQPQDIVKYAPKCGNLTSDDVIVQNMKIDYGKGNDNPVNQVGFFDKNRPNERFTISAEKISVMLPRDYKDLTVRIYSRSRDKSKIAAIMAATENYQEQVLGEILQRTPRKRRREMTSHEQINEAFTSIASRSLKKTF